MPYVDFENNCFDRNFIKCQDHERAYFDSADWALGKVLTFIFASFWQTRSL